MNEKDVKELLSTMAEHLEEASKLLQRVIEMQQKMAAYCRGFGEGGTETPQTAPQQEAALEVPDDWDYIHGTHPMSSHVQAN